MVSWEVSKEHFKFVGASRECVHEQGVILGDQSGLETPQYIKRNKTYFSNYAHVSVESLCWV